MSLDVTKVAYILKNIPYENRRVADSFELDITMIGRHKTKFTDFRY